MASRSGPLGASAQHPCAPPVTQSVALAITWAVACLRACVQVAPASFGNGHQVREQRRRGSVRPRETGRRLLEARAEGRAPPLRGFRRPLRVLGCAPRGCCI